MYREAHRHVLTANRLHHELSLLRKVFDSHSSKSFTVFEEVKSAQAQNVPKKPPHHLMNNNVAAMQNTL